MSESDYETAQVSAISSGIVALISGRGANVVGRSLGEMVGLYLAGHDPASRAEAREALDEMVDELVAFLDARAGGRWTRQ